MHVSLDRAARRSQAERRETTRQALLAAARALFAAEGYAAVGIEEVARRAGVTRGALYHHFRDKRDLFRAVAEEIEDELDGLTAAATRAVLREPADLPEAMAAGMAAFLDACQGPDMRVLLLDGPSVLGWREWHALDARHALRQIEAGLAALVEGGFMPAQPLRPLAHLIHGATIEAALYVAGAEDPVAARAEIGASLRRLFDGLLLAGRPPD